MPGTRTASRCASGCAAARARRPADPAAHGARPSRGQGPRAWRPARTTSCPSRSTRASWPPGCARCSGRRRCRTGSPTCSGATSARTSPPRCSVIRSRSRWVATGARSRRCSPTSAATRRWPPSTRPRTTLDLLNRYLTVVSDAVERHGGTVADLLGDGVFAFFGAPVIHADDPERAVRSALAHAGRGDAPRDPDVAGRAAAAGHRHHHGRGHRRQRRLRAADALRRRRRLR